MSKPYSLDLRERAVAAAEAGLLQTEVVQLFSVSLATLKRWLSKRRAGQSLAPKAYRPGPRPAFGTAEALGALRAQLQADPDGRLIDHCQRWQERTGQWVSVSHPAPGAPRLGLEAQKKRLVAAERDEAERAEWRQAHAGLKPADLVFVDESGSNLAMALRYGWALGGEACLGQGPHQPGQKHHPVCRPDPRGALSVHDGGRGS
jgi:transposase